jgi:phage gpG-like protein
MKFTIVVEGQEQLLASFAEVQEGVLDLRKLGAWKQVASTFRKIEKEIFDSEGSAGAGGKWRPLSTKYAIRKQRKYGQMPILQASGKFYRAMTGSTGDSIFEESPQEMAIGTSLPYAKYHQSKEARKKLPRRPMLDFTREQQQRITDPLEQKLRQLIANAKLSERRGF